MTKERHGFFMPFLGYNVQTQEYITSILDIRADNLDQIHILHPSSDEYSELKDGSKLDAPGLYDIICNLEKLAELSNDAVRRFQEQEGGEKR